MYRYRPYNWGPYSGALAQNVDTLVRSGRMSVEQHSGSRHGSYVTTDVGEAESAEVWKRLSAAEAKFIREVRAFVTTRSFQRLLRDVYAAYPEYATKSQFSG